MISSRTCRTKCAPQRRRTRTTAARCRTALGESLLVAVAYCSGILVHYFGTLTRRLARQNAVRFENAKLRDKLRAFVERALRHASSHTSPPVGPKGPGRLADRCCPGPPSACPSRG